MLYAFLKPFAVALMRLLFRLEGRGTAHVPARGPVLMVANHSSAGSLSLQYCPEPMNDSIVPCEVASKQASSGMICPPGTTSMRNRPPLISSTTAASRSATPWRRSMAGVQVVDIRH